MPASRRWKIVRLHLGCHWLIKTLGISLFMTAFFAAYFYVLRHPTHAVTTMPVTALDRSIPLQGWALAPYLSLWIYVSLAPGLLTTRRELARYALAAALVASAGLGVFYCWPTVVPPADVDWAGHRSFAFLKNIDASGNACPSLHAAFAVFTAMNLHQLVREHRLPGRWHLANWAWALAIAYSTLATKQHVAVDAAAGAALGAFGAWAAQRAGLVRRS